MKRHHIWISGIFVQRLCFQRYAFAKAVSQKDWGGLWQKLYWSALYHKTLENTGFQHKFQHLKGFHKLQKMGVEPTRYCYHTDLNRARLPIPPLLLKTTHTRTQQKIFYHNLIYFARGNLTICRILHTFAHLWDRLKKTGLVPKRANPTHNTTKTDRK